MEWSYAIVFAALGAITGIVATLAWIRTHGLVRRISLKQAEIQLPILGKLETAWDLQADGLYLYEALEVQEKMRRLSQLVDFQRLLEYAERYQISYLGLKGNRPDHSWHPGCLACSTLDWTPQGGYRIYLNPHLDLEKTAGRLSQELGLDLAPQEVQPFLFLHEIGHTRRAGNVCLISAAINSALSGGRRTHRRRKEINKLRTQVEKYADDFALRELRKWRLSRQDS